MVAPPPQMKNFAAASGNLAKVLLMRAYAAAITALASTKGAPGSLKGVVGDEVGKDAAVGHVREGEARLLKRFYAAEQRASFGRLRLVGDEGDECGYGDATDGREEHAVDEEAVLAKAVARRPAPYTRQPTSIECFRPSRGTNILGAMASMMPTSTSSGADSCGPHPSRWLT